MKDNREFLDGMWKIAARLEYEEQQKQAAREKNRRLFLRSILVYSVLAVLFLFLFFIPYGGLNYLLAVCGAFLIIGFAADAMLSRRHRLEE